MASILSVEELRGIASSSTPNQINIPSGHTLNARSGLLTPAGHVVKVLQTVNTETASTTSNLTWVDVPGMSVTITPSSSSNKILVIPDALLGCDGGLGVNYQLRLQRNGSNIYTPTNKGSRPDAIFEIESSVSGAYDYQFFSTMRMFLDSPGTTSAVTYKLQWRVYNGGTVYLNRNHVDSNDEAQIRSASSITVMEVVG